MGAFNGKGKQVHLEVPDWLRKEPDEKRRNAMLAYLFDWELNGFDNKKNVPLSEYFNIGTDGWTKEDTEYIIGKFVEHGYIKTKQ